MLQLKNSEARQVSGLFAYQPILNSVLDLIFPPRCAGCGRVDTIWCEACQSDLIATPIVLKAEPLEDFIGAASTGIHEAKLQDAVQALKYANVQDLAVTLADRLHRCLNELNWQFNVIAPVPLHADRLKSRGYNQAGLLANALADKQSHPYLPHAFQRVQQTQSQVGLTREQRLQNVEDAFTANPEQVSGKIILLIDDVRTTGATLRACAGAAQKAGAAGLYALTVTVARG